DRACSGSTPAAPLETLVSTTTGRPEPRRPVPQGLPTPATGANRANASHQPVDAPIEQEAGAALSTTGTSADNVDPACQTNCSEPPPRITPALFSHTANPTTATPATTADEGVRVARTSP